MNFDSIINNCIIVPVIFSSTINALGIVRSFAKENIFSIVVDHMNGPAFHSRFACPITCTNPTIDVGTFLQELIELGKKLKQHKKYGFIICSNDKYLYSVSIYQEFLKPYYIFPMSEWPIIEKCIDKSKLYQAAENLGIPYPKTFIVDSINDIDRIRKEIPFPCIVKPSVTVGFKQRLGLNKKAVIVNTLGEMIELEKLIIKAELDNETLIIQETIPGDMENLYTISAYTDKNSDILAYSIGHKIRQTPPDAGTITSGKVKDDDKIYALGKQILKDIQFHGISNIEFKKDIRDGSYKLIEINPRPGIWNYSATMAGVNLPFVAYMNVVCGFDAPIVHTNNEIIWIYDIKDFIMAIFLNKRIGYGNHVISINQWAKSIKGVRVYAIWDLDDPMPFIYYLKSLILKK